MREHEMTSPGDRVIAAVSGGADSVCMLTILDSIKKDLGISLYVLHINHHLREEAGRDASFVEELSNRMGLPFILKDVDMPGEAARHGLSEEEAGRILRYQAFRDTAHEYRCQKTAVAHNAGDLAETVLMNLCRGTGLKGLTGIRPVRDEVIRPLLFLERSEIEDYLRQKRVNWVTDETNLSQDYTRNRVRNIAIPWVENNIAKSLVPRLCRTSEILSDIQLHLEKEARELISEAYSEGGISSDPFLRADKAVAREALLMILEELTPHRKDITSRHIALLMDLMDGCGSADLDLPYGLHARREYDQVFIFRSGEEPEIPAPAPCKTVLDCDKIRFQPVWRTRKPGDYIVNKNGQKNTIKKMFIDLKIPKARRDLIPLLCSGSEVLWIPGAAVSGRCISDENSVNTKEYVWPPQEEA